MTDGQKVHRLIGCMYVVSKKTVFYEDLLEDFNDGLWFGKIEHNELVNLCEILVRDELAIFIEGKHPSVVYPSGKESSKGITINNGAFTAYVNKKYDDRIKTPPAAKWTAIGMSIITVAAVAYVLYLRTDRASKLEKARSQYEQVLSDQIRIFVQKDSIITAKDSIIKKQAARIKKLETPPPAPPAKAKKKSARRR